MYSKPACVQCTATYKALDKAGIDYETVDITTNPAARDYVISLGYQQAPVVVAGEDHWSGFRPDRVKAVAAQQRSSSPSPPDTAAAMSELVRATAAPTTAAELTAQHHHTDPTHAAAVHSPVPHQQSGRSRW